jgi:hypothetical protein
MKSFIGSLIAIFAIFFLILSVLGSRFGPIEIMVWLAALVASLLFRVRHYRRSKKDTETQV